MKIKAEVLEVLNNSSLENNILILPAGQLERKLYLEVNKVLEILGGKWEKKLKGHKFDTDIEEKLNDAINFGEITDHKKELQFFETPQDVVRRLVELAEIQQNDVVLEPSAGKGAIVKELLNITKNVSAVEIADRKELLKLLDSYTQGNFLSLNNFERFDKIVMNPPFSKQQDIEHIMHAFGCLKPGGILVSICSESCFYRNSKKTESFKAFLNDHKHEVFELPAGAFKSSGTMVKTRIVKIIK